MLELMLDMSSDVFCWLSSDLYYFLGEKELELEKKKMRCINIMLWNNVQYGTLICKFRKRDRMGSMGTDVGNTALMTCRT